MNKPTKAHALKIIRELGTDKANLSAEVSRLRDALQGLVNIVTHPKATRADCIQIANDARAILF